MYKIPSVSGVIPIYATSSNERVKYMQQTGKSSVIIRPIFVLPKIVLSTKRILLFNRLRRNRFIETTK